MTREEIMQLNTDYLNRCEDEHKMNELFNYVLELQKPCEDCIARQPLIDNWNSCADMLNEGDAEIVMGWIFDAPSVTPQYTDTEIQKMQELEQAEIQKAYELGKEDNIKVLDKIKGYINHIKNTGMGKKKSLEFIEKYINGLKAESEEI